MAIRFSAANTGKKESGHKTEVMKKFKKIRTIRKAFLIV
tara:strand:- start:967 stop:1083 length:117 start_codon:yes stop_codon:yes gene_type:complete